MQGIFKCAILTSRKPLGQSLQFQTRRQMASPNFRNSYEKQTHLRRTRSPCFVLATRTWLPLKVKQISTF